MDKNKNNSKLSLTKSNYKEAEASPGFLFWKAFNAWSRKIRFELDRMDLTQVQYSIMAAISYLSSSDSAITQQDVANQLSMDKMMVSDVVKTLENKMLVSRKPHPRDNRAVSLLLTKKGQNLIERAIPMVEKTDEQFFGKLNGDQRRSFMSLLAQLLKP